MCRSIIGNCYFLRRATSIVLSIVRERCVKATRAFIFHPRMSELTNRFSSILPRKPAADVAAPLDLNEIRKWNVRLINFHLTSDIASRSVIKISLRKVDRSRGSFVDSVFPSRRRNRIRCFTFITKQINRALAECTASIGAADDST